MKKIILLSVFFLLTITSCQKEQQLSEEGIIKSPVTKSEDNGFSNSSTKISKEEALKIVEPITNKYPDRWVDISNDVIPAGTIIQYNMLGHELENENPPYFISPEYDAWLVVVGFDPTFLGLQTSLHIFVDANSGEYSEQWVDGRAIVDWDISRNVYEETKSIPLSPNRDLSSLHNRSSTPDKWAVIISGGCDSTDNYSCFYEDTKRLFNTLINTLDYPSYNIFCLMSDGNDPGYDQRNGTNSYINSYTDFDGDGYSDVIYEATKSRISNVFNLIKLFVQPGDEVLVFLAGHGDSFSKSFCLWNNETLSPAELNIELNKLNSLAKIDVVLGQCYSGYFISTLSASNRTISTSCSSTETAGAHYYGSNASCIFLRRWINSIPIYDFLKNDEYVAPLELFESSRDSLATVAGCPEHPQYDSTPSDFGERHSLKGEIIPYLVGSDYLSTNINSPFTIANYPESGITSWYVGDNATLVSYTDSTSVVKGNLSTPLQYGSLSTTIKAFLLVDGKNHTLKKTILSVWKPGYYFGGNNIMGDNGTYSVIQYGGEYGYEWFSDNPAWPITGYTGSIVHVTEGSTSDPVHLYVGFYDPFGEPIFVMDTVH